MAALSKAEYLKRYMSKDELSSEDKKKKKKRKPKPKVSNMRIIDDDIGVRQVQRQDAVPLNPFDEDEEQPVVVEVVDERPRHVREMENYQGSGQWKAFGAKGRNDGIIIPGHDTSPPHQRTRHDSDSDASPPRPDRNTSKTKTSSKTTSRQRHDSDSDNSPPKRQRHNSLSDASPPMKESRMMQLKTAKTFDDSPKQNRKRHDSDSDQSPIGRNKTVSYSNKSSPRRQGGASDSDQSPPRRKVAATDSDQSPPRKKSDSDLSPPRGRRVGSDSDQSPPRKKKAKTSSDHSLIRKRKSRFDSPPPDRRQHASKESRQLSAGHHSPIRKRRHDSKSDSSPPRSKSTTVPSTSKPGKTLSGAKAGLSSAKEMRLEATKLRDSEDKAFNKIDEATLGKNAQTVVRDRATGKRRDLRAERELTEEEEWKKEEQNKKFEQWGKGVRQQEEREKQLADQVHEASKPLARYQDDEDLDKMMRGEEREEDPMLAFIRNKKKKVEEKKGKKKIELPRYKGSAAPPPNRYNIWPGYRWDGVDRSNGFENKIFASIANKKATKEIAYKWSTEDM